MHRLTARFLLTLMLVGIVTPVALAISAPAPHACCIRKPMHDHATRSREFNAPPTCCSHDCCHALTVTQSPYLLPPVTTQVAIFSVPLQVGQRRKPQLPYPVHALRSRSATVLHRLIIPKQVSRDHVTSWRLSVSVLAGSFRDGQSCVSFCTGIWRTYMVSIRVTTLLVLLAFARCRTRHHFRLRSRRRSRSAAPSHPTRTRYASGSDLELDTVRRLQR